MMRVHRVPLAAPLDALVLETGAFPLDPTLKAIIVDVLLPWLRDAGGPAGMHPAVFLQGAALRSADAMDAMSDHAPDWMPDLGLGMRPHGEPPRMLQPRDLEALRWNQFPELKHETVFHLAGEDAAFRTAAPYFAGSGALLCCLLHGTIDRFLEEQSALWLPRIQDRAFRAHSFYLPLLGVRDLQSEAGLMRQWLGSASVYLRESPEDGGIVIIASVPGALDQLEQVMAHRAVATPLPSHAR